MRILTLLMVTFSTAFSQPGLDFDTTVSFRMLSRDSIYIPPIRAYLYYEMHMTASCPGYAFGDFSDSWRATRLMEKIPSGSHSLIQYTAPCGGIPPGGLAETTYTFVDRQYKVWTGTGDVFMKVTGITPAFEVSLQFSSDPFPTSLPSRNPGESRKPLASGAWRDFQVMQFRNPGNKDWRLLDGRRIKDR